MRWDVQIVYLVRVGNTDAWAMLSVATSWWSLGMGIGKIVLLKDLLPYRNKQACRHVRIGHSCAFSLGTLQVRKVKELEALVDGNGIELTTLSHDQEEIDPSTTSTRSRGVRAASLLRVISKQSNVFASSGHRQDSGDNRAAAAILTDE